MSYQITGSENTLESMIKNYELSQPGEKVTYYTGEHAPEHFPHMTGRDNKRHMMLCALFIFAWNEMCDGRAILYQRKIYAKKRKVVTEVQKRNSTVYIIIKRKNISNARYRATFEKKKCPEILTKAIKKLSLNQTPPSIPKRRSINSIS